jgi:hypothetical protein
LAKFLNTVLEEQQMAKRARRPTTNTRALIAALTGKKSHKYGAKPTSVDGRRFASKREARRYSELKLAEQAGKVRYRLVQVVHYVADFVYCENGNEVVEDVKGYRTREYKAKKKQMADQLGIEIREV